MKCCGNVMQQYSSLPNNVAELSLSNLWYLKTFHLIFSSSLGNTFFLFLRFTAAHSNAQSDKISGMWI